MHFFSERSNIAAISTMKTHQSFSRLLRWDKLHRGLVAISHPALLVLCLAGVLPAIAENGTLLSRTEPVISDDVLKSRQVPTRLTNAVHRARFWKFTYESDGLKVCGYMAAPRQAARCRAS